MIIKVWTVIVRVWTVIVKNLEVSKVLRLVYNYATAGGKFAQTIVPINITSRINETIILACKDLEITHLEISFYSYLSA